MADSQAGYVEPSPGGVTLFLDAETTDRLKDGVEIVRQRVSDPAALMVLNTIHEGLGILTSAVNDIDGTGGGGGASGTQQVEITADSVGLATDAQLASAVAHLATIVEQTDGLEVTLTDIDLNTDQIETSLTNLFNELAEKLEVGQLTGLATFSGQQQHSGYLSSAVSELQDIELDLENLDTTLGTPRQEDGHGFSSATPSFVEEVSPISGFALEDTIEKRYGGGKIPVVATVTTSGDTTVFTPASGNYIELYWVTAINDPDQETTPLIKIKIGSTEYYRNYAISHWEYFEGGIDEPLVVNLTGTGSVAFTAHIKEITP